MSLAGCSVDLAPTSSSAVATGVDVPIAPSDCYKTAGRGGHGSLVGCTSPLNSLWSSKGSEPEAGVVPVPCGSTAVKRRSTCGWVVDGPGAVQDAQEAENGCVRVIANTFHDHLLVVSGQCLAVAAVVFVLGDVPGCGQVSDDAVGAAVGMPRLAPMSPTTRAPGSWARHSGTRAWLARKLQFPYFIDFNF
jgi:hypothetical protein